MTKEGQVRFEEIRVAAALTTSFVAATVIYVADATQLSLETYFTKGSSDGCEIKVETSTDGINYVQKAIATESAASGRRQYDACVEYMDTAQNIEIEMPMACAYIKISAQALTTGTGTSLKLVLRKRVN